MIVVGLPVDIVSSAQAEIQHTCGDRSIGNFVDQNKAAQRRLFGIGFERNRLVSVHFRNADRIQLQRLGRKMLHRVDVDFVFRLLHRSGDRLGGELKPVAATRFQRLFVHPDDRRFELVGDFGRGIRGSDHITAAAIDFVLEGDSNRLTRNRFVSSSPSNVTMLLTVLVLPDGTMRTASPDCYCAATESDRRIRESRDWAG